MLSLSVSFCLVDNYLHEGDRAKYSGHGDERVDITGDDDDKRQYISHYDCDKMSYVSVDDVRRGFSSQEKIQYSFRNLGVTVDDDCRDRYRSHNIPYSSHTPGDHSILLRISGASCRVHGRIHDN